MLGSHVCLPQVIGRQLGDIIVLSDKRYDSPSSEMNNLQLSNESESSAEVPLDNEDDNPEYYAGRRYP